MKKLVPADSVLIPPQAKKVFDGVIFQVYQWPQEMYDGTTETFEMLRRTDTIGAICIVDNKIIILEEEQPNNGKHTVFPAGRVESYDADMLTSAKREVQEETGYSFNNWRLVKVSQPSKKIEWFVSVYLAWDVQEKTEQHLDGGEKITISLVEFDKLKTMVSDSVGYLGSNQDLFKNASSIEDLLNLPEYSGKFLEIA